MTTSVFLPLIRMDPIESCSLACFKCVSPWCRMRALRFENLLVSSGSDSVLRIGTPSLFDTMTPFTPLYDESLCIAASISAISTISCDMMCCLFLLAPIITRDVCAHKGGIISPVMPIFSRSYGSNFITLFKWPVEYPD